MEITKYQLNLPHYCRVPREIIENYDGDRDFPPGTVWQCLCGRKYRMFERFSHEDMGWTYGWTRKLWFHSSGPLKFKAGRRSASQAQRSFGGHLPGRRIKELRKQGASI